MSPPGLPNSEYRQAEHAGMLVNAAAARRARLMLMAPWQWRRNEGSVWGLGLCGVLITLLLGATAVAALLWMQPRVAGATVGGCAFLGLSLVWCVQFGALLRLDHPHAARAVPGHTRGLQAAAVGLWLGLVAICGVASAGAAAWLVPGQGLPIGLAVAAGAGTLLLLLALAIRWWWVWIPLSAVPSFIGVDAWRNALLDAWSLVQQLWLPQPLAATLGLLALQAVLLPGVFGRGDAGHQRAYASRERMRQIAAASAAGQKPALAAYGRWGEWLGRPWQRLSDAWLAHVCRTATPAPRSVMARAEVVLHGPQHWVRHISTLLLVQALVALCIVLATRLTGLGETLLLAGGRIGISIGLTSMALGAVMSLPGALWHSRREQALLLLLPGMPQGAALNRAVAWRQMRQFLWVLATLLPALAVIVWADIALSALAYLAITLPMSAWLWRDVSRLRASRPFAVFGPLLLCVVAGVLSQFLLSRQPGALLPWLMAVLTLTAGLLTWRWRRLSRLPQALPAGRLA